MVEIRFTGSHYYLVIDYRVSVYSQIEYLKIDRQDYMDSIHNFNGLVFADDAYFKNKEDAEKAKEWIESVMLMNQLEVSNEDS